MSSTDARGRQLPCRDWADPQLRRPDSKLEGFHPPLYCPRGKTDCQSLAQIISTGHASFVCCGERDSVTPRTVEQDSHRFCHKTGEGVDVMMNHDSRDLAHIAAVYAWALAVAIPPVKELP